MSFQQPWQAPTSPMLHDPLSLGIGAITLFESLTGFAIGFGSAGLVGNGLLIAGALGLKYAAAILSSNGSGPLSNYSSSTSSQAVKYNERQAVPSKRIIYGTAKVGGALFFEAVKPPYLYQGILICAEQVTAFKRMWIGSEEIVFNSFDVNSTLTPIAIDGQPDYPNRLKASVRIGLPSQTMDGILAADFADLDSSFRQQGIATAVIRYHYGTDFDEFQKLWGQVQKPDPLFLVDGIAIPDPRRANNILVWNPNDTDSVAEAKSSWSFSNNASLVQAHYLTQRYGGRIDPSRVDWGKVAEAADFDDELVACADGTTQRRYTIDGVVTLNQSPSDVVAGMITANRGFICESAGRVWVSSSKPRKPVATVHDKILTGAISIRGAKPKRDLLNRVKTRFIAPDREYQVADGPILSRVDLQDLDGEILDGTLSLPYTMEHQRAQRLGKAYLENGRLGKQISCRCDVSLLATTDEELVGNSVVFDSELFPQGNGIYFVNDWSFIDGFSSIELSLVEYNPSIETSWNAAIDEQPFTLTDLDLN